jgi:ribosomal protein S18 acetylase RimI-like enzyme
MAAIDAAGFADPWCEDRILGVLRQRNAIGMVAEHGGRVVGYMVYELFPDRIELLRLAVDPDARRLGVGRQLMRKLAGKLSTRKRNRIGVHVRESLLPAHLFFRDCGFAATRVVRGHFDGEDAYRFVFRAEADEEAPLERAWREVTT